RGGSPGTGCPTGLATARALGYPLAPRSTRSPAGAWDPRSLGAVSCAALRFRRAQPVFDSPVTVGPTKWRCRTGSPAHDVHRSGVSSVIYAPAAAGIEQLVGSA